MLKLFDNEQRLYMHCKKGTNMRIITWCGCGATINQQLSFLSVVTGSHFLPQASGVVINHPSSTIELSFRACYFYVNDLTGIAKPVNSGEKNAKEMIQSCLHDPWFFHGFTHPDWLYQFPSQQRM
jgi:hypothetical protein